VPDLEDDDYSAAIAASLALQPVAKDTAILDARDIASFEDAVAQAESVSVSWLLQLPRNLFGAGMETLEKAAGAGLSIFGLPEFPGQIFMTNDPIEYAKCLVVVDGGAIGLAMKRHDDVAEEPETSRHVSLIKTDEERFVYGVVLQPETEDSQKDIYSAEEVRKACHGYLENFGQLGKQHAEIITGKLKILENFIAPCDFVIGEETVLKGSWVMAIRVVDDDLWTSTKNGDFTGFSIGGTAYRSPEA